MADLVKRFCNTFLIEGLFVLFLGVLLLLIPLLTTITIGLMVSIGLILVGVYKFISAMIRRDEISKPWLNALISLLIISAGIYLTERPFFNLMLLTMIVAIYFILEGINSFIISAESKNILKYWWVSIVSGVGQFLLAGLILYSIPDVSLYVLGIMIGINMLLNGVALISVYTGANCSRLNRVV